MSLGELHNLESQYRSRLGLPLSNVSPRLNTYLWGGASLSSQLCADYFNRREFVYPEVSELSSLEGFSELSSWFREEVSQLSGSESGDSSLSVSYWTVLLSCLQVRQESNWERKTRPLYRPKCHVNLYESGSGRMIKRMYAHPSLSSSSSSPSSSSQEELPITAVAKLGLLVDLSRIVTASSSSVSPPLARSNQGVCRTKGRAWIV